MVSSRTLALALALLLAGCTSLSAPRQDSDSWKAQWRERASGWAEGASSGASAVGSSLKTAAHGMANGFEEPEEEAFGPFPRGYATRIRKHLIRFERIPEDASLSFGKPAKGYMNRGILLGGGVAWQGWLVDVDVELPSDSRASARRYVVRMRDGEVVEVHDAEYTAALRRL